MAEKVFIPIVESPLEYSLVFWSCLAQLYMCLCFCYSQHVQQIVCQGYVILLVLYLECKYLYKFFSHKGYYE